MSEDRSLHGAESVSETIDAERVDEWLADWKAACMILVNALTAKASLAPGGTRWPRFQLPDEYRTYALIGFHGETVFAGGDDVALARDALAEKLLRRTYALVEGRSDA